MLASNTALDTRTAAVSVRCLGTFSLLINGRPVQRWRAGKTRAFFQLLLVNRGRVVLKDRLEEVLWPGMDSSASVSLRVAVHALRRILDAPPEALAAPVRITFQDIGYVLEAEDIWVDVEEFGGLCARAEAALRRGDQGAAVETYAAAVELYAGDFLPHDDSDWVQEYRQWNRSHMLQALRVLQADAFARRDNAAVGRWCQRALDVDPYHEQTYQMLMSLHAQRGERGQVRRWYELCERRLHELAVVPDQTTKILYTRAMAPQAALTPMRQRSSP